MDLYIETHNQAELLKNLNILENLYKDLGLEACETSGIPIRKKPELQLNNS